MDNYVHYTKDDKKECWYNSLYEYHRTDGPAVKASNGSEWYFINGKLHREDGPALIYRNVQYEAWYRNGKLHREDGPAVLYNNVNRYAWVMDGIQLIYPCNRNLSYIIDPKAPISLFLSYCQFVFLKRI